jgi:hypothetical protein
MQQSGAAINRFVYPSGSCFENKLIHFAGRTPQVRSVNTFVRGIKHVIPPR